MLAKEIKQLVKKLDEPTNLGVNREKAGAAPFRHVEKQTNADLKQYSR
jgi:hypothetical protein